MLISIVVPIYNIESYLPQCIDSILKQSYSDIEIILVDDGSFDRCPTICDDYASRDPRIIVIHKENQGLVAARKDGAIFSSGAYITFVDGDDFILPDRIKSFSEVIDRENVDCICCDLSYYPRTNHKIKNSIPCGLYTGEELDNIRHCFLSNSPFFTFGITPNLVSKCVKRDFYLDNSSIPSEITLGEDLAVSVNLIKNASSIRIIDNSDYMYRYNDSSISHKYDPNLICRIQTLFSYIDKIGNTNMYDMKKQIKEYKCMLIKNIIVNDLIYSGKKYRKGKEKIIIDLNKLDYRNLIQTVKFAKFKDRLVYSMILREYYLPLFLLMKVRFDK